MTLPSASLIRTRQERPRSRRSITLARRAGSGPGRPQAYALRPDDQLHRRAVGNPFGPDDSERRLHSTARDTAVEPVHGTEEARDERVGWPRIELGGRPALDDPAVAHGVKAICRQSCLSGIVRDEQGGRAGLLQQTQNLLAQLAAEPCVEGREGLVQQHQIGLGSQRSGQRHALLLAARQGSRKGSGMPGHAHALQERSDLP